MEKKPCLFIQFNKFIISKENGCGVQYKHCSQLHRNLFQWINLIKSKFKNSKRE